MYFVKSEQLSALCNVCSHIRNAFDGVLHIFECKMRLVFAHSPVNANITNGGKSVEIRNLFGREKRAHREHVAKRQD